MPEHRKWDMIRHEGDEVDIRFSDGSYTRFRLQIMRDFIRSAELTTDDVRAIVRSEVNKMIEEKLIP